jgi:predicted MFS family arabinose efflux permease
VSEVKRQSGPQRLFTPAFIALGVAELCYFTGFGVAIFALPLYVIGPVGGGEVWAGLAFGSYALSAFVLRPFVGRLVDLHGRRPFLVGGALLAAVSLGSIALTENIGVIVALRLLAGVAEAAFLVAGFAALVDVAPPARLGEALSYNSLGLYLGIALGPPLGEILVRTFGFGLVWVGAAALAALAAGLCLVVGETRAGQPPDGAVHHRIYRPALPILVGFLASLLAVGGFLAFASLYGVRVGLGNASLSLLVYGGVIVVCRVAFARVPDRLPPLALGAAALGAIAAGLLLAAAWPSPPGLILGAAVAAVGVAFSTPAFFSAIFATADPSERGAASGTAGAAIDIGLGFGPIIFGLVAGQFDMSWAIGVGAGIAAAGALWTLRLQQRATSSVPGTQ